MEATWLKKGKKTYYGLVVGGHATPANRSDMNELGHVLSEIPAEIGGRCYVDKGYTSQANRDVVHQNGFKDGIMDKAFLCKEHSPTGKSQAINAYLLHVVILNGSFAR